MRPSKNKMLLPKRFANCGEMNEEKVFPMVMDIKTMVPEHSIMIRKALNGT